MKTKDITQIWSKKDLQELENTLCDARIALETLSEELYREDATINELTNWEIQDLADQIAEIENYLFENDFD